MNESENKKEGYKIERRMMKFFKGHPYPEDEVDFETSRTLYEVKSCRLFNAIKNNGNQNREFVKKRHKSCSGFQLGRFWINTTNHIGLYLQALKENKIAKYIFVLRFGGQIIFRIIPWKEIKLTNDKDYHYIQLSKIFRNKNGNC